MKILQAIQASPKRVAKRMLSGVQVYFHFVTDKPEEMDGLKFEEPIQSLTGYGPWKATANGQNYLISLKPCKELTGIPFEQAVDNFDDFEPVMDGAASR